MANPIYFILAYVCFYNIGLLGNINLSRSIKHRNAMSHDVVEEKFRSNF